MDIATKFNRSTPKLFDSYTATYIIWWSKKAKLIKNSAIRKFMTRDDADGLHSKGFNCQSEGIRLTKDLKCTEVQKMSSEEWRIFGR